MWWLLKEPFISLQMIPLAAETVQSTSLAFESVDHVHGGHCLSLGMFGVRHSVTDNVLQEYF